MVGHAQWPGHGLVHFSDTRVQNISRKVKVKRRSDLSGRAVRSLDQINLIFALFVIAPCPAGPKDVTSQLERVHELKLTLVARWRSLYCYIVIEVGTSRVGDYMGFQENNKLLRSAEWRDVRWLRERMMQLAASFERQ